MVSREKDIVSLTVVSSANRPKVGQGERMHENCKLNLDNLPSQWNSSFLTRIKASLGDGGCPEFRNIQGPLVVFDNANIRGSKPGFQHGYIGWNKNGGIRRCQAGTNRT